MNMITAILTVALVVILLSFGLGVIILLGALVDWGGQDGREELP